MRFEYKVVPAPTRGKKARGVKTAADRFAHALAEVMNELAAAGWEYLRTDTLPAEERHGLTGRTTVFQNMLVFRRPVEEAVGSAEVPEETHNIFVEPKTETPAPKLPSAEAAQSLTGKGLPVAPVAPLAPKRGLAAE